MQSNYDDLLYLCYGKLATTFTSELLILLSILNKQLEHIWSPKARPFMKLNLFTKRLTFCFDDPARMIEKKFPDLKQ